MIELVRTYEPFYLFCRSSRNAISKQFSFRGINRPLPAFFSTQDNKNEESEVAIKESGEGDGDVVAVEEDLGYTPGFFERHGIASWQFVVPTSIAAFLPFMGNDWFVMNEEVSLGLTLSYMSFSRFLVF